MAFSRTCISLVIIKIGQEIGQFLCGFGQIGHGLSYWGLHRIGQSTLRFTVPSARKLSDAIGF
jgi:hypothetical protein